MHCMQKKICLVIPCYNEANRLNFEKINNEYYFLFVDDGSTDNTLEVLKSNLRENTYILQLERNFGKAEAIRKGLLHLQNLDIYSVLTWVGYWDADFSIPLYEVYNFIDYSEILYSNVDAVFGSRILRLGSNIKRSFFRHLFGRFFVTIASIVFGIKVYDSQCGAKLFKKEVINKYFIEPFVSKWIFDIEIILRMKGLNIIEYPLKEWKEAGNSKIKLLPIIFNVIFDLIVIKFRYFK